MNLGSWSIFFSSLGGLFVVLSGAYFAWRKLKPETTNIQITTADKITEMAVRVGTFAESQRDDLAVQVRELQQQLEAFRERVDAAEQRASAAEERARAAEGRVRELTEENESLKSRVVDLEAEVERLKAAGPGQTQPRSE